MKKYQKLIITLVPTLVAMILGLFILPLIYHPAFDSGSISIQSDNVSVILI